MPLSIAQSRRDRAFTLIELLVVIFIIGILMAILLPALAGARRFARKGKDATQIRSVINGLTVWGGQNDGAFPRPSLLDRAGTKDTSTVWVQGEAPAVKDNTGNIVSVLIFNGLLEAEQAVSPAETNENIVVDDGYSRDAPDRADASDANKSLALWDPGFSGFPGEADAFSGVPEKGRRKGEAGQSVGHLSYAMAFPFGERADQWRSDFNARRVLAGNRGPQYRFKDGDEWILEDNKLGKQSNTMRFYGREDVWEGHLGYGDGHVEFSNTPTPEGLRFARHSSAGGSNSKSSFLDNVFVNEMETGSDDRFGTYAGDRTLDYNPDQGTNSFIRIWGNITAPLNAQGDMSLPQVGDGSQGNFID